VGSEMCIRDSKGIYHNMRGEDYSEGRAHVDHLFILGAKLGVPSIGIGDGGNEIGMGNIGEVARKSVPYGEVCQCPCGGGIVATTGTDVLLPASVSNWGCYAVAAAAAVRIGKPELVHTPVAESRILDAMSMFGLVDGKMGYTEPSVDGLSAAMHTAMTSLIVETALNGVD